MSVATRLGASCENSSEVGTWCALAHGSELAVNTLRQSPKRHAGSVPAETASAICTREHGVKPSTDEGRRVRARLPGAWLADRLGANCRTILYDSVRDTEYRGTA
jgi:hypothetical protein